MNMSKGVASSREIKETVEACRLMGNGQIVLLKCTSSYPVKIEDANLNTIPNMKETFSVEVRLSDHTLGITMVVVSIALGAKATEIHLILDKSIGGPDVSSSLDQKNNRLLGRSLFIVTDIRVGEVFTKENV